MDVLMSINRPFSVVGDFLIITLNGVALSISIVIFRGFFSIPFRSHWISIAASHTSARAIVYAPSTDLYTRLDLIIA